MSTLRQKLSKIDNYPDYLEAAWQEHLATRAVNAPTVISTFAGCGGSSLGYSMAGFRELLAVEWDNNAVETFKLNFPDIPVYHGDIAKLSVDECLAMTNLKVGELDVFDGSPPCQGFSTAGKREFSDSRNQLFREYVRLLRGLKPKVFVMENVSGMVKGKMKLIFAEIMRELKTSGYKVSARLLNAMYFGVPQSRQRMIFVGVREGLGINPSHPMAENTQISVKQAILQDGFVQYRSGFLSGSANTVRKDFSFPSNSLVTQDTPQATHIILSKNNTGIENDLPAPKLSDKYKNYWLEANQGDRVGKFNSSKKLNINSIAFTITKAEGYGGTYHPIEPRGLSGGERKRIASFPDRFIFLSWQSAVERIGNSVPPLFMRAIAKHIRKEILDKILCPANQN